jgi:hypothetical protein
MLELVADVLVSVLLLVELVLLVVVWLVLLVPVVEVRVAVLLPVEEERVEVLVADVLVSVEDDVSDDVVSVVVVVVVVQTGVSGCFMTRLYGAGQPSATSQSSLSGSTTPTVISTPLVSTGMITMATASSWISMQDSATVYLPGSQQGEPEDKKCGCVGTIARASPMGALSLSAR